MPHADVPAFFFLFFFFTLRGFTTSSRSKSSELMTLNLCELGWPPLPSSRADWGPEPLSVELSELLLLLGSLATELATEAPLSLGSGTVAPGGLGSGTVAPGGLSVCCAGTCSGHPGVSRLSRAEKEEFHLTTAYPRVDVSYVNLSYTPASECRELTKLKESHKVFQWTAFVLQAAHISKPSPSCLVSNSTGRDTT